MKLDDGLWQRVWQWLLVVPALGVLVRAVRNYVLHQSANQAGSLAFSAVLAMFPLLILLSATAGYVGLLLHKTGGLTRRQPPGCQRGIDTSGGERLPPAKTAVG